MTVFMLETRARIIRLGRNWVNICSSSYYASRGSSGIKMDTRRVMRLDELFSVVRLERRTTEDSSSKRLIHLVPVFILDERRDA